MDSFCVNTTAETNERNNPETARSKAWDMISNTFNSKSFQPTSHICTDLHRNLAESLDISFKGVVPASDGRLGQGKGEEKVHGHEESCIDRENVIRQVWQRRRKGSRRRARFLLRRRRRCS